MHISTKNHSVQARSTSAHRRIFSVNRLLLPGLLLLGQTGIALAQAPVRQWDTRFGGSNFEFLNTSQPTSDGGQIMLSNSFSGIDGDKTVSGNTWLVKTSATGIKQWDVAFSSFSTATCIQQTTDGGYMLGGSTNNGGLGSSDYQIIKMDANGAQQWTAVYGGASSDELTCLQQTTDGGYILGGHSASGISGDKTQSSRGGYDYWIVKIDNNGTKQWDSRLGGNNNDELKSLQQTTDGGYILTGKSPSFTGGEVSTNPIGGEDYWMVKTDVSGTKQWDARFGGSLDDFVTIVRQTSDGGYILGGFSYSGISGNKTQASRGGQDYWIVKTDASGTKQWDATFGGNSWEEFSSLIETTDGGYLLAGLSASGISGDKTQAYKGDADGWLVKTDANGTKQWDLTLGGDLYDALISVHQTPDGGYMLGGCTESDVNGDVTQPSRGDYDNWLVKLSYPINWTGAASTSWSNTANWHNNIVPTDLDWVVIPDVSGTSNNFPQIDMQAEAGSVTINANASLQILSGYSLTSDQVLTNNGTLVVSDNASLVQTTGAIIEGSGTYTVRRNKPNGVSFVSSPINGIATSGFGITPTGTNGGQVIPNQQNPCNPTSVDPASPYGNIMELRENPASVLNNCAQSLWHVKSAGTLQDARGYSMTSAATTLSFSGTINNGNVTYPGLTRQAGTITEGDGLGTQLTRGWHLVGNPYPSPITLTAADLTALGFDGQVHRYDNGSWIVSDPLAPVTIAVGQGFQIRKSAAGGTADLVLTNAMRTAATATFYKPQEVRTRYLHITLSDAASTDNTVVYFMDNASDGFDPAYDANRLTDAGNTNMIYTRAADERLSYNALKTLSPGQTKSVPLSVRTSAGGSDTLTFHDVHTLQADVQLEDLKLRTKQSVTDGYRYPFTTQDGDSRDRFVLHFNARQTSSVYQVDPEQTISLFPNPTNGSATLMLYNDHSFRQANIADITGRIIRTYPAKGAHTISLQLQDMPGGIYFIRLTGTDNKTLKLIKQ